MVGFYLNYPLTRGCFAMQDMRTPLVVAMATIGVKLFFSLVLTQV